jgi:hypothetical protein
MHAAAVGPFQDVSNPDSSAHSANAYTVLPVGPFPARRKRFSITRIPIAPLIPVTSIDGGSSCNNLLQKTPCAGPTEQTLGRFRIQRIPIHRPQDLPMPEVQRPTRSLPAPLADDDDLLKF